MIAFSTPVWLLLLGLLPWLRWLHRFQRQGRLQPTSALFMWRHIRQSEGIAGNAPASPDPRWRLRALIIALMILTLADPLSQSTRGYSLVVWLDDSLSQFTREGAHTRLQQGIDQLVDRVKEGNSHQLRIHSLANPAMSLMLRPGEDPDWIGRLKRWTVSPRGEPQPPPPALMHQDAHQIVLTDGADATLNHWLRRATGIEIIQTGTQRNNSALTRLAVRRPLGPSQQTDGIVELSNLGQNEVTARLILIQHGRVIHSRVITLAAGESNLQHFSLALDSQADLIARLQTTGDPLLADNELRLPIASRMQPVHVLTTGSCSPHLQAFLAAHPALEQTSRDPDISIACGTSNKATSIPLLRLHPVNGNRKTQSSGHWHAEKLQHITLPKGLRFGQPGDDLAGQRETLWVADNTSLLTETLAPAHVIDVNFDLQSSALAGGPQYPLLLSALIERLVQRPLSESALQVSRPSEASRITPLLASTENSEITTEKPGQQHQLNNPLIILALFLLLIEIFLELRSRLERRA